MLIDDLELKFVHILCDGFGEILTPFFAFITFLGEKGWFFVLIGIMLCFRKKTRWVGATIVLSIAFGYIIGSCTIKPFVARLRPFLSSSAEYYKYWIAAGSKPDEGFSMPSGHTIAIVAFFTAILTTIKKSKRKVIFIIAIISTILMILSRTYFMHHYFTDCLVGMLVAIVITIIVKQIVKIVLIFLRNNSKVPLFDFILNFDIAELFGRGK